MGLVSSVRPLCILELGVGINFRWARVAELDDRYGFEHSASQPLRSTLPWPPTQRSTWSVPLRIPAGAYGAGRDDDDEEEGDQPGNTIQYAHGNSCVVLVSLTNTGGLYHLGEVSADRCTCGAVRCIGDCQDL